MRNRLPNLMIMVSKLFLHGLIMLILTISTLWANSGSAQDSKVTSIKKNFISLELSEAGLFDIMKAIEDQTAYKFSYDKREIDRQFRMKADFKQSSVEDILLEISKKANLRFKQVNNSIHVKKIKENLKDQNFIEVIIQTRDVSGKVTSDEDQEGLPGVNVVEKGTSNGTVTNVEGEYRLTVSEGSILVFSSVGFTTEEVAVGNRSVIDLEMVQDVQQLQELVVVGYGTMKKSDLTGAVNSVDVEQFEELPNVSVMQSLQGSVPGLNVGAVNRAGQDPSFTIRGQNTLSSGSADNSPLIVVDGIIYRGNLIDINPADIESVDILKDASSASIYGSQAANGVIIISTKNGSSGQGKPVINYSGSYSMQVPSNKLEPMNSAELEEFFPDIFWSQGSRIPPDYLQEDPNYSFVPELKTLEIAEGYANGLDNDWWGMLTGNGYINNHNVSVQGASENFNYFVSGGISDVEGFLENDTYTRYNYRLNLGTDITNWLNLGVESFLTTSDYSGVSPSATIAFAMQPWAPITDENGEYILTPEGSWLNPLLNPQMDDEDKRFNVFATIHADVKLPFLEGFNYRVNFSQNYRTENRNRFNPWGANFAGSGYKNEYNYYDWTLDNIFSYNRTFNNQHNLQLTFLYGVEKRDFNFTEVSAQNFTNDLLGFHSLEAGDPGLNSVDTGKEQEASLYSMGRAFYSFNNRYMITGTIRRDGFSGFGTENKVGVFPSIALGWVMSEESFFQESLGFFDYFKVRASYGVTGRRGANRYDTKAIVGYQPSIVFGDGNSATFGQWISSMANDNLGWETTTGVNLGLDYELFEGRLSGSVEYYNNDTENILYPIQLPAMTGFQSINTNIGKVHNNGLELLFRGKIIDGNDFKWDASINFSRNRNEIVSILGRDNDEDGVEDDLVANGLFIGEPQEVIFDYEIIGMWQLADEEAGTIPSGFFPGTYKIADLNDDGAYSASDDRKIIGYRDPSYRFGITNTLSYKNFSLYIFINSIQGGRDFYYGDDSPYRDGGWFKRDQLTYFNAPSGAWDYWMPENPNARYRRLDQPSQYAPRPYSQRNFIRLQDVSLAYNFSSEFLSRLSMSNLKVFISGKNLITLTKWRGWDPETGEGFTPGGFPLMTNYNLGVNVSF